MDSELEHWLDAPGFVTRPSPEMLMEGAYSDVVLDAANPWGLPDWRCKPDYDWMNNLYYHEWRWEFIRRNPRYRQLWLAMQKKRQDASDPDVIFSPEFQDEAARNFRTKLMGPHVDCRDEEINQWLGCGYDNTPVTVQPVVGFEPALLENWLWDCVDHKYVLARIDPWAPLGPQLDGIKVVVQSYIEDDDDRTMLGEAPPGTRRRQRGDKYGLYLRLLDARGANASYSTIAMVLAKERHSFTVDQDSVKRLVRTARDTARKFLAGSEA